MALDLVGFGLVLPLLPLYARRFGASPTTIGLLVASFSLAQFVFAPVWGRLSDRMGRKPVLVLSLAGTAVGSLLTGLAGGLLLLFVARVIDGISGASVSVAQASVADVAPEADRARLLGLLGAAFGVGFVVGPALGALGALVGPRVPFYLAAAVAGVNAVAALRRLPETHPGHERRTTVQGGGPLRHRPDASRLVIVAFAALVAFSAFEATFSLFGARYLGLRLASTGAVFTAVGLLIVVVQVRLIRPAVARFGEEGTLRMGLALDAVGLVVLALVAVAHSWFVLVPALVVVTVGQGLVTPTLSSRVAGGADAGRRGRALGVQQSAGSLARVVGPAAGGAAFQHMGPPAPFLVGAVLMVGALAVLARPPVPVVA